MVNNTTYRFLTSIILLTAFSFGSSAQGVKVKAEIDSSSIVIGEQTKLKLTANYRVDNGKNIKVKFPELVDTIRKEIEIADQSKMDSVFDKNDIYNLTLSRTYLITSFDSGYWAIPPFKFIVNDDTAGAFTEPLLLQVTSVAVDTTQAIKDIKPPFEISYTLWDWIKDNMYIVYIVLATIVLVILVIYLARKFSKRAPVVFVEKPKIPPHIIALEKLEKIKTQNLWQEGKIKLYYSSVTDTVREYIEERFKIQALEQTTAEIIYGFRNTAIDEESFSKLKELLKLSDLVKFAKETPMANENEKSLQYAFDFINGTKQEEIPTKPNKNV